MRKDGFLRTVTTDELSSYKKKENATGISLYTGAGGADIGFSQAGFKIRVMVENDKYCCKTLRRNWLSEYILNNRNWDVKNKEEIKKNLKWYHEPEPVILERDIIELTTEEILKAGHLEVGEATVVFGGSPCQGFSLANRKRNLDDPRNRLIWEFWRVVNEALPQWFFFENVPGMVYGKNYPIMLEFSEKLASSGYDVTWDIINAADFGVPQNRKRVILIGKRADMMYLNQETERIQYHIACVPGKVVHPGWFVKKHGLKPNKQFSLKEFKSPTNLIELLQNLRRETVSIKQGGDKK